MNDSTFCCDSCLVSRIARDEQPKKVRALGIKERVIDRCRCGNPAMFELWS